MLDAEDPLVEDEEPVAVDEEKVLPGVLVERLEPVGDAVLEALLTVLV